MINKAVSLICTEKYCQKLRKYGNMWKYVTSFYYYEKLLPDKIQNLIKF